MSCWISCCSFQGGIYREYWVLGSLMESAAEMENILFDNFLSESQCPETVKINNHKNAQDSHWRGTSGSVAVPEAVRTQSSDILVLVWRFCAFQVICLFSAHSVAFRLHQFGWGFGVVFGLIWSNIPKDWKLLQRVPIGTSYQHRLTRREKAGVPGAVQKGRKGFCYHHKWCKAGRKGFNLDCAEDLDPVVSIYRPGACSAKPGQCIILFTIKLSFIWKPDLVTVLLKKWKIGEGKPLCFRQVEDTMSSLPAEVEKSGCLALTVPVIWENLLSLSRAGEWVTTSPNTFMFDFFFSLLC